MSPVRARPREPDAVLAGAEATSLARQAAEELAPGHVGDYLGPEPEAERVVTHLFACLNPAYRGWRWAVTVSRASRSKTVTISECVLLPSPEAVLAPPWVPWRERLRPGDLGVGDILPAAADDERLVPAVVLEGEDGVAGWAESSWAAAELEPGLPAEGAGGPPAAARPAGPGRGRRSRPPAAGEPAGSWETVPGPLRVLSAIGRDEAALRWYTSEHGPGSPLANAAPGPCLSCGFFVHLAGPLGRVFGVCANEFAPDDGRVVSVDHGCGAHSEGPLLPGMESPVPPVIDELGYDLADMPGVSAAETEFEPIEHN